MTDRTSRTLAPTLWRTCRTLANRRRLLIMQYLFRQPECTVSQVARRVRLPPAVASQYLRMLNARGLLQATRRGRWVLYRAEPDPLVPQASALLKALRSALQTRPKRMDEALAALTAFTHPRRIALMQVLARGPLGLGAIQRRTGISKPAIIRHMRKLERRGWVAHQDGRYRCVQPGQPLATALRRLVS